MRRNLKYELFYTMLYTHLNPLHGKAWIACTALDVLEPTAYTWNPTVLFHIQYSSLKRDDVTGEIVEPRGVHRHPDRLQRARRTYRYSL